MFSPVTIASSTTMPSTMMKPNRLIMLIVTPVNGISISAPRKLAGMPINTQSATAGLRNMVSNRITRMLPWMPLLTRVPRRAFRYSELSSQ